jgi:hypothetical protein
MNHGDGNILAMIMEPDVYDSSASESYSTFVQRSILSIGSIYRFEGNVDTLLEKPEAPTGLSVIQPTYTNEFGTITGLNPEKAYEYRSEGATAYIPVAEGATEIPSLQAGTYYVRFASVNGGQASDDVKLVVNPQPQLPKYTVTFYGADGNVLQILSVTEGTRAQYTGEAPTKPYTDEVHFVFESWVDENGRPAKLDSITSDEAFYPTFSEGEHNYEASVTAEPTCTATGMKHIACTRCDKTFDETAIDAKGHAYSTTVVAPTCTADGYTKHQCARCPDAYNSDIVPKSGHQYTTRDEPATCTTAAYRHYTCMRCTESTVGHAYSEKVSESLGHDYEVRIVAAKCKEDGETRKVCTRCNENEPGSIKVLPATGHTYTKAEVTKDMGNSTVRTATVHTCASCGEKHVSKIVFTYSKSPSKRVNANKGYCYGMTVDYSDLTSATVQTFRVNTAFTYNTDELLGIDAHTHFYITATGELDNSIGIFDKTSAISSSFGYIEADNPSNTWGGYVDIAPDKVSEKKCVYFAFMNYNYTGAFIVKSLSATATFEFGEPVA